MTLVVIALFRSARRYFFARMRRRAFLVHGIRVMFKLPAQASLKAKQGE